MNEHDTLKIMIVSAEDRELLDRIYELELKCFDAPWSKASFEEALSNRSVDILAAQSDGGSGSVIGFCIVMRVLDEAEILNVGVDPYFRRRGVARTLLTQASNVLVKEGAKTLYLEVRASNAAARSLYEVLGFEQVGLRRRYYTAPSEDAVLMSAALPLTKKPDRN